jgi:uncharacterized membrane protein
MRRSTANDNQHRISIKAIILGVLIDYGGTFVLVLVSIVIFDFFTAGQTFTGNHFFAHMRRITLPLHIVSLVGGLAFTFLGALVAARIAKRLEVLHGAVVGCIAMLPGLLSLSSNYALFNILSFVCTLSVAMFGGYIASKTIEKNRNVQSVGSPDT